MRSQRSQHAPALNTRSVSARFAAPGHSGSGSDLRQQLLPFPDIPDPQQQLLCDVLHVKPSQAQLLQLSCPGISTMSQQQLSDNWQQLQQLLPLPQHMLLQAAVQVPSLILQPQQTVSARLAESARALGLRSHVKASRRGQTVQLHWRLLLMQTQQLERQLDQLSQLLGGLPRQHVVQLVCAEPRLLDVEPPQLLSTVEALEQICGCRLDRLLPQLRRDGRLLGSTADSLYKAAAGLQQVLRLSEEGVTLVARRAPAALMVPPERLADLLTGLSSALSVSMEVAADILLQEPELLMRSAGAVVAVLTALRVRYRLNADALLQVVQFDPSILAMSPGQLSEEAKQFRLLATSHPAWRAEYRYLMSKPVNVARALRIEPLRLQRLVFLSRQGLAGTVNLTNALTLSGRKFVGLYPKYPKWLAAVYSAGNAPQRYAAAAAEFVGSYDEDSEDDSDY